MTGSQRIASVLVDSPLPQMDRPFDYAIPEAMQELVQPGVRVRVPVRSSRRRMDGWVLAVADHSEFTGRLVEVDELVSPVPVLAPEIQALTRSLADRAAGSMSDLLRLAIPKRYVRVEQGYRPAPLPELAALAVEGYPAALTDLVAAGGRAALSAIPAPLAWARLLVQAASGVLADERSAILVLPDRRDIERLLAVAGDLLPPERIVRVDADQPPAERYRAFLRCRHETGLLIVGGRSAVYAPATRLGLIAIWDDGDPMLAEPLAPGVHSRDAALVRQELSGAALLLAGHSRSTDAQRLVEAGWLQPVGPARRPHPRILPTAMQHSEDRLAQQARIPTSAWRLAREAIAHGPVLVQVSRPGEDVPVGSERTAGDLGRAFPMAHVVVADAVHPVDRVSGSALVIATRGAEPVADGGYRAVLLLDGERMLARESLRVAEDAVRTWANAVALAAPDAGIALVGVTGRVATALSGWRLAEFAAAELADRRAVRMPPAVRTATISGVPSAVEAAIEAAGIPAADVIAPVRLDADQLRAVIRFDYRDGSRVAAALRAEVLRHAAGRRGGGVALRVRLDDAEPFGSGRPGRSGASGGVGAYDGTGRMAP